MKILNFDTKIPRPVSDSPFSMESKLALDVPLAPSLEDPLCAVVSVDHFHIAVDDLSLVCGLGPPRPLGSFNVTPGIVLKHLFRSVTIH